MKRTKLSERILPTYTKGEEIFNMTSHIVGGAFGIVATVLCVVFAAIHHNVYGVVSGAIYGASMIILYTMSSIYHGLHRNNAKKVFQVLDHCTIFLLIAGSYTPFALCTFREYNTALGWSLFGIIWGVAILGIVLNAIDLKKYKIFSMICNNKTSIIATISWHSGDGSISVGRNSLYNRCSSIWSRKKTQIYTFNISFIYIARKFVAIFLHFIICNVKIKKSRDLNLYNSQS